MVYGFDGKNTTVFSDPPKICAKFNILRGVNSGVRTINKVILILALY